MNDDDEPRTLREEIAAGLPLSDHELGVLEHAAAGENATETGTRMHLSPETVRSYRRDAIAKLAARNTTHAVVIAVGLGYFDIEPIIEEHQRRMGTKGAS